MMRRSARMGAATFALGLSLAGPQAQGVAWAEAGGEDSASVSAGPEAGGSDSAQSRTPARESRAGRMSQRAPRDGAPFGKVSGGAVRVGGARQSTAVPATASSTEAQAWLEQIPSEGRVSADAQGGDVAGKPAEAAPPTESSPPASRDSDRQPAPFERHVPDIPIDLVSAYPVAPDSSAPVALTNSRNAVARAQSGISAVCGTCSPPEMARTIAGLNTAVVGFFDAMSRLLSSLPANPVADLLSGALLLVRRSLFDQAPTGDPLQLFTNSLGQIEGDLGARDPEDDPLTFKVVESPAFGAVEVGDDGFYVYTPGSDFAGFDSFTVRVADANGGFNLFDPFGDRSAYIEVRLPDNVSPFDPGNADDVILSLNGVSAQLRLERHNGAYRGTVSLEIPDHNPLTWLDEDGRNGTISALDVANNWGAIQDAGNVRLAIDFITADGVEQMAVLDSVQGSYDAGRYVFSGALVSDTRDGAGVDSYYDVLGPVYKPQINAFLAEVLAASDSLYEQSITGANLSLDTWSVKDWRQELADSDLGLSQDEIFELVGASAARSTIEYGQLLNQEDGGTKARDRLKGAINHALTGGKPGWSGDPIFNDPNLRPPLCNGSGECNAYVYMYNLSKSDGGLYSILSKSVSLGSKEQSVDFSLDFGPAIYGYAAVPKGVKAMTDLSKYSLGFFVSLVAGPSVTLKLGEGDGKFTLAETQLFGAEKFYPTEVGTFSISGDLKAALNAQVDMQKDFTKDELKASLYVKAGGAYVFNVNKFPTADQSVPQFVFSSGYLIDPDYQDFKAITGVSFSPTLTPSITASWGLFTPKDTPVISRTEAFSLNLGYSNPISADLRFAANINPSLTIGTRGELTFTASVFKEIVDDGIAKIPFLGSAKGLTTYEYKKQIFDYRSGNLLV